MAVSDHHPGPLGRRTPPRILIAEDDPATREMLEKVLLLRGWRVIAVPDGEEALAAWRQGCFDLVLLDLGMPSMSGDDVAKKIRATEAGDANAAIRGIPILALSGYVRKEEKQRCLQSGVNEFLAKPIRLEDLYAAITRNLLS